MGRGLCGVCGRCKLKRRESEGWKCGQTLESMSKGWRWRQRLRSIIRLGGPGMVVVVADFVKGDMGDSENMGKMSGEVLTTT